MEFRGVRICTLIAEYVSVYISESAHIVDLNVSKREKSSNNIKFRVLSHCDTGTGVINRQRQRDSNRNFSMLKAVRKHKHTYFNEHTNETMKQPETTNKRWYYIAFDCIHMDGRARHSSHQLRFPKEIRALERKNIYEHTYSHKFQ